MTFCRRTLPLAALAWAVACAGGPGPRPAPGPEPVPPPVTAPTPPRPTAPPPARQVLRLENGVTAVITTIAAGRSATLQFGISAGAAFMAPGVAELAAHVLVEGDDPSQGRVSLRQAIARMGGTLQVHIGPLTSWIDLRVAGHRWPEAMVALREALQAPSWSRNQIDRIRERLVAARTAALREDPATGMGRLLLLGESSGASYLLGLLDRDPSEISLFLARVYQPDRAVLALDVPAEVSTAAAELARSGRIAFGAWAPAPAPGPVALLDRKFESGLWWSPAIAETDKTAPCRIALVTMLPDVGRPTAADEMAVSSCFSLEGAGGRLEQLQRERGLGHVRWQGNVVQTPDAAAVVLTADVPANEVVALWRTVELARNSLRDVPPNASELAIALARVPLLARLIAADDGARVRTTTRLLLTGTDFGAIDRRLSLLASLQEPDLRTAAEAFLAGAFAMVVLGGEVPADVPGVRRFDVLPGGGAGLAPTAPTTVATSPTTPQPWLTSACDAVGGTELLRRLDGWQWQADLTHEQAPAMAETLTWSSSGTLQRTRTLLGQKIETSLAGSEWFERSGATVRSLDAREAGVLRREMQRHPLALLAAHARGELSFRTIAQRDAGDRTVVVLEAIGDRFDRLRVHVDTQSHLVRVVETWETLAEGTVAHVQDAWQDYRSVAGIRVPYRRLTTQNDGQNRVETVFSQWTPRLRPE